MVELSYTEHCFHIECSRWLDVFPGSRRCRLPKGHLGGHNAGTGVTWVPADEMEPDEVTEMERFPVAGSWSWRNDGGGGRMGRKKGLQALRRRQHRS